MNTFEQQLSESEWTEVLDGGSFLAFDLLSAINVEVIFSEDEATPLVTATGNAVKYWPDSWDMEVSGMVAGLQRVWLKGSNIIRGVRG